MNKITIIVLLTVAATLSARAEQKPLTSPDVVGTPDPSPPSCSDRDRPLLGTKGTCARIIMLPGSSIHGPVMMYDEGVYIDLGSARIVDIKAGGYIKVDE